MFIMRLFITLLFTNVALFAHPHIFIDIFPKVNIQNSKVTSLHIEWKIDQMTSSMLIMKYDKDKNHILNNKELAKVKKSAIKSLKKYNYYLKIMAKDKNVKVQKLDNFVATVDNMGRLVYNFDLICNFDVKESILIFYYKNNYIAYMLKKSSIAPLNKNLDFDIRKIDNARYFGYAMQIKDVK